MQRERFTLPLLSIMIVGMFSVPLLAHVSVNPRTAPAGSQHMVFFIRAPVEFANPVIELGLEVGEEWRNNGGDINSFQHVPGWDLKVEFDDEGRVEKAFWTGGEAPRETFMMFYMSMNVPEEPGDYTFKAWQLYADGKRVEFIEPRGEGVEYPMPIVAVEGAPFLTAGTVQVSAITIALFALAVSLLSYRNHRKKNA